MSEQQPEQPQGLTESEKRWLMTLLEFQFIDKQHDVLLNMQAMVAGHLKKNPFDATALSRRDRIKNDLDHLTRLVTDYGLRILGALEHSYGIKFQILTPQQPSKEIITEGLVADKVTLTGDGKGGTKMTIEP